MMLRINDNIDNNNDNNNNDDNNIVFNYQMIVLPASACVATIMLQILNFPQSAFIKKTLYTSIYRRHIYIYIDRYICIYIYIYIIREEAQSFETHDLRCRACLPNSELAVWWTSVSRWFLV